MNSDLLKQQRGLNFFRIAAEGIDATMSQCLMADYWISTTIARLTFFMCINRTFNRMSVVIVQRELC